MPRKHKTPVLHYVPATDDDRSLRAGIEQILIDECKHADIPPAEAQRLVLRAGQQIFALITKQ